MNNMKIKIFIFALLFILFSCNSEKKKKVKPNSEVQQTEVKNENSEWEEILPSVVKIDSYDNDRILETGQGFFVGDNLIVTKFSLVSQANKIWVTPLNENKKYLAEKFVAVDRINDIIIIQIDSSHLSELQDKDN